jgi:integrase
MGWHDLRHTYGSHWAMKGVALKVFQELMGHATLKMTMRYATSALRRCGTQCSFATRLAGEGHYRGSGSGVKKERTRNP